MTGLRKWLPPGVEDGGDKSLFYISKPDDKIDRTYRTIFGPAASFDGIIYSKCNHNISLATNRLTVDPDPNQVLAHNQTTIFRKQPRWLRRALSAHREQTKRELPFEEHDWYREIFLYADLPHPKRKLRLQAALDIEQNNMFCMDTRTLSKVARRKRNQFVITLMKASKGKMKLFEWAKPGKYPRLIVDMTVPASLLCGFLMEKLKGAMASCDYKDVEFVKSADIDTLTRVFQDLGSRPCAKVFSDDSCFSIMTDRGLEYANMDASTMDASPGVGAFEAINTMAPPVVWDLLHGLIMQLTRPMHILDSSGKTAFVLKANKSSKYYMSLKSGSGLTTYTNTFLCKLFHTRLRDINFMGKTRDEIDIIVKDVAESLGLNMKIQWCNSYQQLQFLKHSPNSEGKAWLNWGTMLRTIGVAKGDIPIRGKNLRERAYKFNSALVKGFQHAGDSSLYRLLAEKYDAKGVSAYYANYMLEEVGKGKDVSVEVTDEDVCLRYGLADYELWELLDLYAEAGFGDVVRCTALDKIMELDYGYPAPSTHRLP